MIRVLLAEDHHMFREAMSLHLSRCPYVEEVFEAADTDEAVRIVSEKHPEIVFMDIEMPGRDVFDAVREIQQRSGWCKVLFLSGYECDSYITKAIEVNACGYILKRDTSTVITDAIAKVLAGEHYFSESIQRRLGTENGRFKLLKPRSVSIAVLTHRERELLTYLGRGAHLKEAAESMNVSYKTADNQKASIMRKLNIHDRVKLARFAICEGLIGVTEVASC